MEKKSDEQRSPSDADVYRAVHDVVVAVDELRALIGPLVEDPDDEIKAEGAEGGFEVNDLKQRATEMLEGDDA